MQQALISSTEKKSNKKVLLLAALGVVATIGVLFAVFNSAPATTVMTEVSAVDSFIANAFAKWQVKYDRIYTTEEEAAYRLRVFRDNFYVIKAITDEGSNDFTVGLNKMADLTPAEFRARYISGPIDQSRPRNVKELAPAKADRVDWRDKGAVNPIKDQGFCGSCWAFSANGALEGLNKIKNGKLLDFSEQELVDCSTSYGNQGCNGGLMTQSFEYTRDHQITTTSEYKYEAADKKCRADGKTRYTVNKGYTDVKADSEEQLAAAVETQPTSVAVQADQSAFQFYTSGVITKGCGTSLNHGILAVGYIAVETDLAPHWICKNSWGAGWGDNGYVRIKLDFKSTSGGVCGIAMMNTFPTL
jgi:C1A family cysteine protease